MGASGGPEPLTEVREASPKLRDVCRAAPPVGLRFLATIRSVARDLYLAERDCCAQGSGSTWEPLGFLPLGAASAGFPS